MMHTVLRMPRNMLCHSDLIYVNKVGGPKLRSITAACAVAQSRAAFKTVPMRRQWISQLSGAAKQHLPLHPLVKDTLTPACWDSPPLAVNLREASLGFPSHPHFDISGSDLICKLRSSDLSKMPRQKLVYAQPILTKT